MANRISSMVATPLRVVGFLACLTAACSAPVMASAEEAMTRSLPSVAAPKTDGALDAAEWQGALHFTEFRETAERRASNVVPPGLRTEAWLAKTPSGLCVAFRCHHDQMSQLVTAVKTPDGPVWADDSVEVFLDAHGTRFSYYHFIVNAAGAVYDAYNKEPRKGDGTWDSGAMAAGRLLSDGYSVEMLIPWTSLNLGLNRDGTVGLNLCRNVRYTVGRQSLFGEYHSPASWRTFRLEHPKPPLAAESIEWSPLAGKNEVIARLRNVKPAPLPVSARLVVTQGSQRQEASQTTQIAPGGQAELRLPYTVSDADLAHFRLALLDSEGKEMLIADRILQPQPLAAVSLESDVLERDEKPSLTVSLAVSKASASDYAVRFSVRTPDGKEVFRRDLPPSAQTRLQTALDLSQAPPAADRLEIETTVTNVRTGKEAFRGRTPIRLVSSPWADVGQLGRR